MFNGATERDVTISNFSLFNWENSSALAWIASISFRLSSCITFFKNSILLFNESTNVTFKLGNNIFITNPGKPAPVPTSHNVSTVFKSIILLQSYEENRKRYPFQKAVQTLGWRG